MLRWCRLERLTAADDPGAASGALATDWLPGAPPDQVAWRLQAAGGPLARLQVRRLVVAVVRAYARLHAAGVVHADVHPGNVRVEPDGCGWRVRLLDLGLARLDDGAWGTAPRACWRRVPRPRGRAGAAVGRAGAAGRRLFGAARGGRPRVAAAHLRPGDPRAGRPARVPGRRGHGRAAGAGRLRRAAVADRRGRAAPGPLTRPGAAVPRALRPRQRAGGRAARGAARPARGRRR
nr:AarF/UbiB family protein [Angustibacter aerolatus]